MSIERYKPGVPRFLVGEARIPGAPNPPSFSVLRLDGKFLNGELHSVGDGFLTRPEAEEYAQTCRQLRDAFRKSKHALTLVEEKKEIQ